MISHIKNDKDATRYCVLFFVSIEKTDEKTAENQHFVFT